MSRIVFALVVPLVAIVIVAILGANAISLGFAGEGCRFHDGKGLRWSAAGEAVMMQLIFGIGFALALAVVVVVLRQRFQTINQSLGRAFEWAAISGFLLLSVGAVLEAMACRLQPYTSAARVVLMAASITFLLALALLLVNFVRGLVGGQERP